MNVEITQHMGERIRQVRLHSATTQEAFAISIGVTRSALYRIEKGEHSPHCEVLQKLCKVYQVDANWILGLEQEQKKAKEQPETVSVGMPEHYKELAQISSTSGLWKVVELVQRLGPISEEELQKLSAIEASWLTGYKVMLRNRNIVGISEDGHWYIKAGAAPLMGVTEADAAAVGLQSLEFLIKNIIPAMEHGDGALALATMRVEPTVNILEAIREALVRLETPNGKLVRIMVGATTRTK